MGNATDIRELPANWREEAETLRRRGADAPATALESAAADLEEAWEAWRRERLTLDEAAEISHLSKSTIQQKVAEGAIPNAGEKGRPRIERRDIPKRKPMRRPPSLDSLGVEEAAEELAADALTAGD